MTSRIEWLKNADGKHGYTINPVKGLCPVACPYCYARRMYKRFKWNPEIRYDTGWEFQLPDVSKPSKIFVGSTMELFGDWVKPVWRQDILQVAGAYSEHTFIFLTKRPENLPKVFPDNCWVGLSVDGTENAPLRRIYNGLNKCEASVKFISFEPLLAQTKLDPRDLKDCGINWVIIGQQTPVKASTSPKIEWVKEIVTAADAASVPVFLKGNLNERLGLPFNETYYTPYKTAIGESLRLRQEFPVISFSKEG